MVLGCSGWLGSPSLHQPRPFLLVNEVLFSWCHQEFCTFGVVICLWAVLGQRLVGCLIYFTLFLKYICPLSMNYFTLHITGRISEFKNVTLFCVISSPILYSSRTGMVISSCQIWRWRAGGLSSYPHLLYMQCKILSLLEYTCRSACHLHQVIGFSW